MGFFRKSGVGLFTILLIVFLVLAGFFLTFGLSLSYNNVQENVGTFLNENIVPSLNLSDLSFVWAAACKVQNLTKIEFPTDLDLKIDIPCTKIVAQNTSSNELLVSSFIEDLYYKKYSCEMFFGCFRESKGAPTFMFSEKARFYFMSKFWFFALLALISIVVLFFLVEKKHNFGFLTGGIFVLSAFFFLGINSIASDLAKGELGEHLAGLIDVFFSGSKSVFSVFVVLGIFLIVVGIVLWILEKKKQEKEEEPEEKKEVRPKVAKKKQ